MVIEDKLAHHEALQSQVDRILRSDEFRSSEVLRRLLSYLVDKAISGEADQLKEYVIAIEGLGKPSSYDPQHNSAVRIQVGRLRQKLAEYYRTEGKNDAVFIDLPKGRFRLTYEQRQQPEKSASIGEESPTPREEPAKEIHPQGGFRRSWLSISVAALLVTSMTALYFGIRSWHEESDLPIHGMTPDLATLWGPFVKSKRPLIISIEDPLFAEMRSNPGVYFRDRSMNEWKDVLSSPAVKTLTSALKKTDIQPSRYYTAYGEVDASFMLGRLLGPYEQNFSLVKTSQLSWQQLADNNVVFVGVQNLFFDQLRGMPIAPQLIPELEGIRNIHPLPGELPLYPDHYSTAPSEEGTMYALVTHLPGPVGHNDVESFTSVRSAGYVAAVQWFTDPSFAGILVSKLKESNGGKMPHYYQVLLKVKFKDNVPTETTYVLSRILHQ
ncbi:MAG TPA: hypothetical protein VFE22_03100 [Edaphobacter sp.]|nr:hypothetical protein [Edaphobacter sp.]